MVQKGKTESLFYSCRGRRRPEMKGTFIQSLWIICVPSFCYSKLHPLSFPWHVKVGLKHNEILFCNWFKIRL